MQLFRPRTTILSGFGVLLVVGLLIPASALAQERGKTVRTADYDVQELTFPALHDFDVPEPRRVRFDNGMTLFLLEDHELPQINAVARIGTGSAYEPVEKRGLASITGTVMRTGGTASMSPDSVNQTLENIGASVETSIGQTSGSAYLSTLSDQIDTVLPVFAEVLRAPAFAEEKVSQAKSQQRSAISRRNDNARQIASREFDKLVYGEDSPYSRTPEYYTVDRIQRQDLVDFHDTYFHPNNVILSVWGDFDADAMEDRIREQFADWTAPEDFEPPTPPEPTASLEYSVNFVQKDDVNQSTIYMGHLGEITRRSGDYASVRIMNEVLSGGFSGRLFQNVRRDQGLAYSVFGAYTANYDRPGRFYAGVASKSETTVEATDAVMMEIDRMRQEPPTDEELSLAKDSYLNSFVFNFDTKREILGRLMSYEKYDYPADFLQQMRDAIERVTAEDVQRVAEEYLYPNESHILVVGRQQDFSDSLATLTRDETVNHIDITIPREPPAEEGEPTAADEQAMEEGRQLMANVKEALGGSAFDEIDAVRIVSNEQGNERTLLVQRPNRIRAERSTPMGTITIADDGETMTMETPKGTRTAPPSFREQVRGQLWKNVLYVLMNLDHEDLSFRAQDSEAIDGTSYEVVEVRPPAGESYTLYLETESLHPVRLTAERMNPKVGAVTVERVFRDYQEIEGLQLPFASETTQSSDQGEQSSTSTIERIDVNPDLSAERFTLEVQSE